MKSLFNHLRNKLFKDIARKSDLDRLYDQISGMQQIQNAMDGKSVLRPMRGWAMSPDAMAWILADLHERKAPTVIEFGSGQSTVIFASLLRAKGAGRLISVEHDPKYAQSIQQQLAACGLDDLVDFQILDLEEVPSSSDCPRTKSYPVDRLPDTLIDIALIDGPPMINGSLTRFYPLDWTLQHLSKGGSAYLDDSSRPQEQEVIAKILKTSSNISIRELSAEKGLTHFTRS